MRVATRASLLVLLICLPSIAANFRKGGAAEEEEISFKIIGGTESDVDRRSNWAKLDINSGGMGDMIGEPGVPYENPTVLLETNLQAVGIGSCKQDWEAASAIFVAITAKIRNDIHLCAQAVGRDSCQGDTGGPLV